MKRSSRFINVLVVLSLVAFGAVAWTGVAMAAELQWAPNSTPGGGDGAWNQVDDSWYDGVSTFAPWANGNNDIAVFGGKSGTATLGEAITVGGITFNDNAGYVITGETLTFGVAGAITANVDATIESNLAGGVRITKEGAGKLTLTGTNSYSGGTTINGGILSFSSSLSTGGDIRFNNGGVLEYTGAASLPGTYALINGGDDYRINVTDAAGNMTVAFADYSYKSIIKGGDGTLTVASSGGQDGGGLEVDEGTAVLNGSTVLGWGCANVGWISDVKPGATVQLANNNGGQVFHGISMSGGTFDVNGHSSGTTAAVAAISGTGTITNTSATACNVAGMLSKVCCAK